MSRNYPRFLFSDPVSTKSKGPFIFHTVFPRVLFRVHKIDDAYNTYKATRREALVFSERGDCALEQIQILDVNVSRSELHSLFSDTHQWLISQMNQQLV